MKVLKRLNCDIDFSIISECYDETTKDFIDRLGISKYFPYNLVIPNYEFVDDNDGSGKLNYNSWINAEKFLKKNKYDLCSVIESNDDCLRVALDSFSGSGFRLYSFNKEKFCIFLAPTCNMSA